MLVDGVPLPEPRVGDLLGVPATGAYCFTMANNYNGNRRIPVVFAGDGNARLVVRRETWDDLLARDVDARGGGEVTKVDLGDSPSLGQKLLRRKPVTTMTAETGADSEGGELSRSIGLFQLTLFGVGATIGTGIFIVLTQAVPVAGPATIWSFVIAGTVAGLTAICYAELASAVPVSGSSYSYAYATMGEGVAIIVAACLLLEYGVSAAAVAVGWSQYLNEFFDNVFGFTIPDALSQAPEQGGVFNLPAVILSCWWHPCCCRGASESAKVNTVMVLIKIGVLLMFIIIGLTGWNSDHFSNFAPFGISAGSPSAAGIIFFSYIGLDAVSTAGEEVQNPQRTMPLAIIVSLVIVTTHLPADRRGPWRATAHGVRRPGGRASRRSSRTSPATPGRPPSWRRARWCRSSA